MGEYGITMDNFRMIEVLLSYCDVLSDEDRQRLIEERQCICNAWRKLQDARCELWQCFALVDVIAAAYNDESTEVD